MKAIKENNILLAEFLGWEGRKVYVCDNEGDNARYALSFKTHIGNIIDTTLKFHLDYSWLMLVVDKIETIETKDKRTFTIDFYRDSVLIFEYGMHTNEIIFTEGKGRLLNLYNACVQFVKWYNER